MVCEHGRALGRYMYMRSVAISMPPSGKLDGHEETMRRALWANTSSARIGTNAAIPPSSITAQAVLSDGHLPMDQ